MNPAEFRFLAGCRCETCSKSQGEQFIFPLFCFACESKSQQEGHGEGRHDAMSAINNEDGFNMLANCWKLTIADCADASFVTKARNAV
jgi:hypothetical protein